MGLMILAMLWFAFSSGQVTASVPISLTPPPVTTVAKHYTELDFPPLPEITLPDYERYQLANGMVVYLMPDRELPLISGSALIRTGSRWEPSDKVGLGEITGTVMRTGGTKNYSPDELNQLLEQQAAVVETSIGDSSGSAGFEALSEDIESVFPLFAQVIREPAFAAEKLQLAKRQQAGGIARRNDEPSSIAFREFNKLVYGATSPYARTVEYATLENISREDVVQFYQRYFYPKNMVLGIVGDFEVDRMKKLVEKAFGDWQTPQSAQLPEIPQAAQKYEGNTFFVNQPQLTQSNILMGHLGGKFDNPDYPALSVLNGILNGFGGRLFNEVRSRQGLAYSVYGVWSPRFDYPGIFIAGGQTRSDATVPLIQAMMTELERLKSQAISAEELNYAKESILNSFVFNFQDPAQTLSRLMRYEYYDYPEDFIFQYQREVKAVSAEDVQRVARKYLKPEDIITLVVGNGEEIEPALNSLGKAVETVDISIPSPQRS